MGMMNLSDKELIYALRNNVGVSDYSRKAAALAADRIEQLVAINSESSNAMDYMILNAIELEDKLAKAWPRASPAEISNRWRYERNLNDLALAELEKDT